MPLRLSGEVTCTRGRYACRHARGRRMGVVLHTAMMEGVRAHAAPWLSRHCGAAARTGVNHTTNPSQATACMQAKSMPQVATCLGNAMIYWCSSAQAERRARRSEATATSRTSSLSVSPADTMLMNRCVAGDGASGTGLLADDDRFHAGASGAGDSCPADRAARHARSVPSLCAKPKLRAQCRAGSIGMQRAEGMQSGHAPGRFDRRLPADAGMEPAGVTGHK